MKLTDNIVEKVGSDKLLHFLVAGWFTQIGSLINWQVAFAAMLIIIGLNYLKEIKWDSVTDYKDLYAAMAGSTLAFLIQFII